MKSSSSYSRIRLILNLLPIISFNLGFPSQTLKFLEDLSGRESTILIPLLQFHTITHIKTLFEVMHLRFLRRIFKCNFQTDTQ